MLVKAFHIAEVSMLAPFVLAAIIWGMLMFGDVPSLWTISGAGVVICSGLYVWYGETLATKLS
jgi:drug/metabolite transporter (DMT)-like permease